MEAESRNIRYANKHRAWNRNSFWQILSFYSSPWSTFLCSIDSSPSQFPYLLQIWILRDSASSFHWLSSSIFSYWLFVPHRWHLLSSPLYDVFEHTNHLFSVGIWSWKHVILLCMRECTIMNCTSVCFLSQSNSLFIQVNSYCTGVDFCHICILKLLN